MYNNEKLLVDVYSFTSGIDSYGLRRLLGSTTRQVWMYIDNFNKMNLYDNPIFIDCTDVGLTLDRQITDKNEIEANGVHYLVLYVLPTRRFSQIFMKAVK